MGTLLHLARRFYARFRRDRLDDQLAEEIRLHIELRTQALIDGGSSPADAARDARRMFGNTTVIREETRDMWGFGWAEACLQDLRYGARQLWRAPWFSGVAVLSLAIGIGAAAAVFNVADAVLFRELPLPGAQRLHSLRAELTVGGGSKRFSGVTDESFAIIQRGAVFADIIGFRTSSDVVLAGTTDGERPLRAEFVSANYFDALEITTLAGRMLGPADASCAETPVVLSERTWRGAFNGDAAAVGRRVTLNGAPGIVVGIASDFAGLVADHPVDLFVPLAAGSAIDPGLSDKQISLVTKLKPGVSVSSAEQQLKALISSGQSMMRGGELRLNLINASRGIADSRTPLSRPLWLGLALVGALLLVACANTGGLLVARFASRQREFGVRIAIGAGRARLVRQLTLEALMLGALAALLALAVAWICAPALLRSVPIGTDPLAFDLRFDWRLAAFTGAISALAALLAAAASSVRLLRTDPLSMLAASSRTVVPGRRALTNALIAAQVACSLLLLAGAGAMARTLINLTHVDPGFDPHETFAVRVDASHRPVDGSGMHDYYSRLQEQIAALPLVERVSVVQIGLLTGAATSGTADIIGFVPLADDDRWVRMFFIGSGFFDTTGMIMVAGESLRDQHISARARVAVVNEQFARFYFGTPDRAIGRTVNRDIRIIGVVADARYDNLRDPAVRAMFVPFTQVPPRRQMTFEVRPADSAASSLAVDAVTAVIRSFDAQLNFTVTSGADRLVSTMARERFTAALAAVLSLLAVFLSCLGLYAAVAYAVSERRHELAVRLALGATGRDILGQVIRDPLRTTAIGIVIGLPCVYLLMQGLSSLLFNVATFDAPTVLGAAALLLIVGALAGIPAAIRAASIDPQEALQWE